MKRGEAGFTLVEVLVVLVAGGLLLVSLSWVLQGSARDFREAVLSPVLGAPYPGLASTLRLVEAALPSVDSDAGLGGADTAFVVAAPAALGLVGPVRLELLARREGGNEVLVARFSPLASSLGRFEPVETEILSGVSDIDLVVEPAASQHLPASMKISFVKNGEVSTYRLKPRVTADGACRFDPISLMCR